MFKLLLVEDEIRLQEVITDYFMAKGSECVCANNGLEALQVLEEQQFDLIILDVMMPEMDGFSLCRQLRKQSSIPIIFLTARSDEKDQLYGFQVGADDYIVKPFSLGVLYAKAISLIKRSQGTIIEKRLTSNEVCIDLDKCMVFIADKEVKLAPKEYELLVYLISNKNQVITREQLINRIWGYEFDGNDRVIDTHIKKLRKALGVKAKYIHTAVKVGYRWEDRNSEKK